MSKVIDMKKYKNDKAFEKMKEDAEDTYQKLKEVEAEVTFNK
jgi:hypothetical protein